MKAKRDQLQRDALERKVQEKDDRMAAIEDQRRALMLELETVRADVAKQDIWIKVTLCRLCWCTKWFQGWHQVHIGTVWTHSMPTDVVQWLASRLSSSSDGYG